MEVYRASPEAVEKFISRSNRVAIPAMVLSVAAAVVVLDILWSMTWLGYVVLIPTFSGLLVVATRLSRRQLRGSLGSVNIILHEDAVELQKFGSAVGKIARADITRIRESSASGLSVQSRSKTIVIPPYINGYEGLRATLSSWCPVENDRRSWRSIAVAANVAFATLFVVFFVSSNTAVIVATGAVLFAVMLAGQIYLLRSPLMERKIKALMAVAVPIPFLIILVRIYWVLR